jgi:hypothetical protein
MPLPSPLAGIFYPSLDVPQVPSVIVEDPDPIALSASRESASLP